MSLKVKIIPDSFIAKIAARQLRAPTMAITVGNKIYLHNTLKQDFLQNKRWLCHELKHVQQFRQYGFFNFLFKYILESLRKGYYLNKYEIEARTAENDLSLMNKFEIN